jgi:hypothetical protein
MPQRQRRGKAGQPVRARQSLEAIPAELNFKFEIMVRLWQRMFADVR